MEHASDVYYYVGCHSIIKYITFYREWQMNRNIYVNVIWHIPVTPENYLN